MSKELYELVDKFVSPHLTMKWDFEEGKHVLENAEALLETLRQVKTRERRAVGSGTGASSAGSTVKLSLAAVEIEQRMMKVLGSMGFTGRLGDRLRRLAETADSYNEVERIQQLSAWSYEILGLVERRESTLEISGACTECGAERCVYEKPGNGKAVGTAIVCVTDIELQQSTAYCRSCFHSWSHSDIPDLALML